MRSLRECVWSGCERPIFFLWSKVLFGFDDIRFFTCFLRAWVQWSLSWLAVPSVGCDSSGFGEDICYIFMLSSFGGFLLCLGLKGCWNVYSGWDSSSFGPVWWPSKVQARADGCLLDSIWSRSFVFVRFEYVLGSGFCSEERSSLFYTFFCFNCVYRCSFDTPGLVSWVREGWLFIWTWLLALFGVLFWFFFPFLFLKNSGSELCLISADMMLCCRCSLILGAGVCFLYWLQCCGVGQGRVFRGCWWRPFLSRLKLGGEVWRARICFWYRDWWI